MCMDYPMELLMASFQNVNDNQHRILSLYIVFQEKPEFSYIH